MKRTNRTVVHNLSLSLYFAIAATGVASGIGVTGAAAQTTPDSQQVAPKWNPQAHVAPAYMYRGLPRQNGGVVYKAGPSDPTPVNDPNATLDLDNRRISDPATQSAPVAKDAIISAPQAQPLTLADYQARLQVAQATYAGAKLGYTQAKREGDQARMTSEQAQMATSMAQITQLQAQIKAATPASKAKKQ